MISHLESKKTVGKYLKKHSELRDEESSSIQMFPLKTFYIKIFVILLFHHGTFKGNELMRQAQLLYKHVLFKFARVAVYLSYLL